MAPRKKATTKTTSVETAPPTFLPDVALDRIIPSPHNPREGMDQQKLEELADSIHAQGILEPLIVAPHPADPSLFSLIAGHRRLAAAEMAEHTTVPVLVRSDLDEKGIDQARLVENLHREDLSPIEQARGFRRLIDEHGMTQMEVSTAVGLNQGNISRKLSLLNLVPAAQGMVQEGKLGGMAGYNLAQLAPERQVEVVRSVAAKPHTLDAALNTAKVKQQRIDDIEEVKAELNKRSIPWVEVPEQGNIDKVVDEQAGPIPVRRLRELVMGDELPKDAWDRHRDTEGCCMAFIYPYVHFISVGNGKEPTVVDKYVEWGCTDPEHHREEYRKLQAEQGLDPHDAPSPDAERAAAKREREEVEAAEQAAILARRIFIKDHVIDGRSPKGAADHLMRQYLLEGIGQRQDGIEEETFRLAAWLLGHDEQGMTATAVAKLAADAVEDKGDPLLRQALAVRLAQDELAWKPTNAFGWQRPMPGVALRHHLDFLCNQGYELTPAEKDAYDAAGTLQKEMDESWYDEDADLAGDDDSDAASDDERDPIDAIA